jgi:hypothetical protein
MGEDLDNEAVLAHCVQQVANSDDLVQHAFGESILDDCYQYECEGRRYDIYPPAPEKLLVKRSPQWVNDNLVDFVRREIRPVDGFRTLLRETERFPRQIVPVAGHSHVVQGPAVRTSVAMVWYRRFSCAARKDGCRATFTVGAFAFDTEVLGCRETST